jgi:hypothetical protein
MRANDFLNEADEESRKDKAMAAAMANVMKQKAEIDARNAEVEKQSNAKSSQYDVEYNEDDYKSLLAQHDWYYDYSDDHSVWQRGNRERDTLYKYQDAVDPDYKIWNEYAPEMFQRKMREAVIYHGNPNKDDDERNAARRKALAKQDNKVKLRGFGKEKSKGNMDNPAARSALRVSTRADKPAKENVEEKKKVKQRLDPKCWDGYKKDGTKMKGGVRVNNCVPK